MSGESIKTKEDKLRELNISPDKWGAFTDIAVDVVYNELKFALAIQKTKQDRLLFLLNAMLEELKHEYIEDISKFIISRDDIMKLDGEKYVNKNKETLVSYGFHLNNDLYYSNRRGAKVYSLTVLRGIAKFYGFDVKSKLKTMIIDSKKTDIRHYILVKVEKTN